MKKLLTNSIFELGKNLLGLVSDVLNVAVIESKLAKKSFKKRVILLPFLFIFAFSTWLCFLGSIFFWLSSLGISPVINFGILTFVNLFLFIVIKYLFNFYAAPLKFLRIKDHLSVFKGK